jgi:CDP-diglyceride synthetase
MTVKKSLENRIRGWFPQEPVFKAAQRTKITSVNRDRSFKVRRWLHGASAFISSLMGQISLKTKLLVLAFGFGIFSTWLLYYLTINDFIDGFVLLWAGRVVPSALFILVIASYASDYFKNRAYRKNHPSESISPILRLWGTIIGVIGGAIVTVSYFLTLLEYSFPELSTIPFYLGLVGALVFLLGCGLYIKWRKRNKLEPFQTATNNFH